MFVRSTRRPFGRAMHPALARGLFIALYTLYPLGCILRLGSDAPGAVLGLLMVAAAFVAFAVLAGSSLQRQAQEPDAKLDERELSQRNKATYRAFSVFAGVVLLGVIYLQLRMDLASSNGVQLWSPTTSEHWSALFWGLLIMALTLPAAFLAWEKEPPVED